jgi:hypothetical protein
MPNSPVKSAKQDMVEPQNVPITNPDNVKAVYANHFGVSATMTDFTIYFLELGQVPGLKGSVHTQEMKAIVTLPLMVAAGMIQVLQQVMQKNVEQLSEMKKLMDSGKR